MSYQIHNTFHCECGHKVADHRLYFSGHNKEGLGKCSVPDCTCESYARMAA